MKTFRHGPPRMPLDYAKICETYHAGASLSQLSELFEISLVTAFRVLDRSGVKRRARGATPGKPRPSIHRGPLVSLCRKHVRLRAALGKADHCEECGTRDPAKLYDWSNQTGNYDDFRDFKQMCRACHVHFDAERRRITGRSTQVVPIGIQKRKVKQEYRETGR